MKILILVLSYKDNGGIYDKFYETQKLTWDSELIEGVQTLYYYGECESNEIIGDKINLNCPEGIHNTQRKMKMSFDMVKNFDFDYLVRTNSSSYVDKKMLYKKLSSSPKEKFVSAVIGNHNGLEYPSGAFFILSRDIFDNIVNTENSLNLDGHFVDDVCLGEFLQNFNYKISEMSRFDVLKNLENEGIPNNYIHYRLRNENREDDINFMKLLHEIKKLKI